MEISEREMQKLVADADDQHRDAMRTFRDDNRELIFGETRRTAASSRRALLKRAGLGGLTVAIGSAVLPFGRLMAPAHAQETSDADIATFAASFEFAAVQAYQAAAESGKVTTRAVLDAATTFAGHHQEHGQAFAALASDADVGANPGILEMLSNQLEQAADEAAVIQLAFETENAAASTYLFGLGVLTTPEAFNAAASILPVESQHAVTLGLAMGRPVTDADLMPAFEPQDKALDPAEFPVA